MEPTKGTSLAFTTSTAEPKRAKRPASGLKMYVQRNMYRWHRIIGLITVVPVIFWCVSGMSHPFMAHWFKPTIAHEFVKPDSLNKAQLRRPIQAVLAQNNVTLLRSFRIVSLNGHRYYQVMRVDRQLAYFDTETGAALANGDRRYAESLARYFVGDTKTAVRVELITEFSDEYRYVNRLLPVWKVSFGRADQMDVYVDTEQTRLANYNERSRKAFLWLFNNFHSWEWLGRISSNGLRISVMVGLLSIVMLSMLSGLVIYGFMWKRFRRPRHAADTVGFLRNYHRQIGIAVSVVTLTFAFSGAYQATRKLLPDERIRYVRQPVMNASVLQQNPTTLPVDWTKVINLSLTQVDGKPYYQVFTRKEDGQSWKKKQVDNAETAGGSALKTETPTIAYYDVQTAALLPDGVIEHAKDLVMTFWAAQVSGGGPACCEQMASEQLASAGELPALESTAFMAKFDREYGFINKRLPVVKLTLATPDHLAYYIEPATSRLAAQITDGDRRAGLSFSMLHKFSLIDWAGKNVRDGITVLAAFGVLVVSLFGLALFLKIN